MCAILITQVRNCEMKLRLYLLSVAFPGYSHLFMLIFNCAMSSDLILKCNLVLVYEMTSVLKFIFHVCPQTD